MLIALLYLLLNVLFAVIIIEIILAILGWLGVAIPRIRQLLYALVGVIVLIWLVQLLIGSTPTLLFSPLHRP